MIHINLRILIILTKPSSLLSFIGSLSCFTMDKALNRVSYAS